MLSASKGTAGRRVKIGDHNLRLRAGDLRCDETEKKRGGDMCCWLLLIGTEEEGDWGRPGRGRATASRSQFASRGAVAIRVSAGWVLLAAA